MRLVNFNKATVGYLRKIFLLQALIFGLFGCAEKSGTTLLAEAYFDTYAKRENWELFTSFYSDSVRFVDVDQGLTLVGKEAFFDFYHWSDSSFALLDPKGPALVVESMVVEGFQAVARGYFTPFYFQNELMAEAGWPFVIWLEYNADGRIISQQDFILYKSAILK